MSLIPSYVICEDGKAYKNLVYKDTKGSWFICFDDDEPTELVAKKGAKVQPAEILAALKFPYLSIGKPRQSSRVFGKRFIKAESWFLNVPNDKPFPNPRDHDAHEGAVTTWAGQEAVWYGPFRKFKSDANGA